MAPPTAAVGRRRILTQLAVPPPLDLDLLRGHDRLAQILVRVVPQSLGRQRRGPIAPLLEGRVRAQALAHLAPDHACEPTGHVDLPRSRAHFFSFEASATRHSSSARRAESTSDITLAAASRRCSNVASGPLRARA